MKTKQEEKHKYKDVYKRQGSRAVLFAGGLQHYHDDDVSGAGPVSYTHLDVYKRQDLDYKSPRQMIERLCHARKVGANYLLNIGLTGQGGVTKMTEALLEVIGQWTAMAKDSLYDGKVCDIRCSHEKDFVLEKDGAAYVYVHDLPLLGPKDVVAAVSYTHLLFPASGCPLLI